MGLSSVLGPFEDVPGSADSPSSTSNVRTGENFLQFIMQEQEYSEWCWAATAASVSQYYAKSLGSDAKSQCEVATGCIGYQCCKPLPPDWDGNRIWALEDALDWIGHLAQRPMGRRLGFSEIVREIDNGRPICCQICWQNGDGHFNAIVGYGDNADQDVIVRDPCGLYGNSTVPYKTFATNYHGGSWKVTYLTK